MANTYDYPILGTVALTCNVIPDSGSLPGGITYQWNTDDCYTNSKYTPSNPQCFPHGQTTQTVTGDNLNAEDAGTIRCIATINSIEYTSGPFTLRISGEQLVRVGQYYDNIVKLILNLMIIIPWKIFNIAT